MEETPEVEAGLLYRSTSRSKDKQIELQSNKQWIHRRGFSKLWMQK